MRCTYLLTIERIPLLRQLLMAKRGKEKNTNNKAKHSKLVAQKKNKIKSKNAERKARLKAIVELANAKKENGN